MKHSVLLNALVICEYALCEAMGTKCANLRGRQAQMRIDRLAALAEKIQL